VILVGVVNLFADMTYEGARSVSGAFLGQLGASAFAVGLVAGGGELIGYGIRLGAGIAADRLGIYWLEAVAGYAINLLCVPALALAGSWPAAAGLVIGERLGRGIRKPAVAAMLAEAGTELGGAGRVFGINELLDQIGATIGPLIIAFALSRGSGYRSAFAYLLVPALLAIAAIVFATLRFHRAAPAAQAPPASREGTSRQYRLALIGGALFAAGFVDYALIAYHFNQTGVVAPAMIPIFYAVAMVVAAIGAPIIGRYFDRSPIVCISIGTALSAAFSGFVFLGGPATAQAGIVLWGIGLAVQETALLALVARISAGRRRGTAFGGFDAVFGVAWFAGSALLGFLYGRSLLAVVLFSTAAQLAAIPFFVAAAADVRKESASSHW
jgi:predicted MFS family arabinose efflux permease